MNPIILPLLFGGCSVYLQSCTSFFLQKSLVMRIRIAYKMNNKDVLEEGQINNFPQGLWSGTVFYMVKMVKHKSPSTHCSSCQFNLSVAGWHSLRKWEWFFLRVWDSYNVPITPPDIFLSPCKWFVYIITDDSFK